MKRFVSCAVFCLLLIFTKPSNANTHHRKSHCKFNDSEKWLTCRHFLEYSKNKESVTIEVKNFAENLLNITAIVEEFPNLRNLIVNGAQNPEIEVGEIQNSDLKNLELKQMHLTNIPERLLTTFQLDSLDLTGNNLQKINIEYPINSIKKVYLADNQWNCTEDLSWVKRLGISVIEDSENVTCVGEFAGKPIVAVATILEKLNAECPNHCDCTLTYISSDFTTSILKPIFRVNCSGKGLKELPPELPENTKILVVNDNEIEDLEPLVQNPIYRGVDDLYLDNNRVNSVDGLEGSYWLSRFRVLSLRGNHLNQLPTYAFDNSLQRNPNMPSGVRIYLGSNPWRCDCIFTPGFQELLRKYRKVIDDLDNIRCSYTDNDGNSLVPIYTLSRSSVCRPEVEYSARALDILNGVLASLIILILGKLAYDYYHFKRTGKLPWIVMKMP